MFLLLAAGCCSPAVEHQHSSNGSSADADITTCHQQPEISENPAWASFWGWANVLPRP